MIKLPSAFTTIYFFEAFLGSWLTSINYFIFSCTEPYLRDYQLGITCTNFADNYLGDNLHSIYSLIIYLKNEAYLWNISIFAKSKTLLVPSRCRVIFPKEGRTPAWNFQKLSFSFFQDHFWQCASTSNRLTHNHTKMAWSNHGSR